MAARDSVCEQCHLEGEVRIFEPRRTLAGLSGLARRLEPVFSIYLVPTPASAGDKAVSQSEQLAMSRCARESGGRLWCGTCHDPHSNATNRAEEVRVACLTCHAKLFTAQRHRPTEECTSCHMPRIRPTNVAHAAITSHRITSPTAKPPSDARPVGGELTAWRRPPAEFAERNLGLALFEYGRSTHSWSEVYRSYPDSVSFAETRSAGFGDFGFNPSCNSNVPILRSAFTGRRWRASLKMRALIICWGWP